MQQSFERVKATYDTHQAAPDQMMERRRLQRTIIQVVFLSLLAWFAWDAYRVTTGGSYLALHAGETYDRESARHVQVIGLVAAALCLVLPLGLWGILLNPWKAVTRFQRRLKFALWPGIFLSFWLAGPIATALAGLHSQYSTSLTQAFDAWLLGSLFLGAISGVIGFTTFRLAPISSPEKGTEAP
jgi:hypothetical protein